MYLVSTSDRYVTDQKVPSRPSRATVLSELLWQSITSICIFNIIYRAKTN